MKLFKILNGYENIDINMFFSIKKDSRTRGHEVKLVKNQCRLDIRKQCSSLLCNVLSTSKVSLKQLQSLIDVLNVACSVITPGRAFLRRFIIFNEILLRLVSGEFF